MSGSLFQRESPAFLFCLYLQVYTLNMDKLAHTNAHHLSILMYFKSLLLGDIGIFGGSKGIHSGGSRLQVKLVATKHVGMPRGPHGAKGRPTDVV